MPEAKAKCAVTGAQGYVGSIITSALGGAETTVGLVRRPRAPLDVQWSFTDSRDIAPELRAREVKVLVHSAWDMHASSAAEIERVCVKGSLRLFEAADRAGVERIVFISTISAFSGCRSVYGRKKLEVEQMVHDRGGLVLRLGLVFGPDAGGAFGNLYNQVRTKSFVPVINAGREPQYLLSTRTLAEAVRLAAYGRIDVSHGKVLTVAHPQPWTFRELIQKLAELASRDVRIIPIPWRLLYTGLRSAEVLGLKLPVHSDSVISVVYANPHPDFAPMLAAGIQPQAFPGALAR